MTIQSKTFDKEEHNKVANIQDLNRWAKEGGWVDAADFLSDTGINFDEIKDKWFYYAMGRLFIKDRNDFFGGMF